MTSALRPLGKLFKFKCITIEDIWMVQPSWGISFCHPPNIFHRIGVGKQAVGTLKACKGETNDTTKRTGDQDDIILKRGKWNEDNDGNDEDEVEIVKVVKRGEKMKCGAEGRNPRAWKNLFATCGGPSVRVYEACPDGQMQLLQVYEDRDEKETYYSVAWTYNADGTGEYWVLAGGCKGVLRVISMRQRKVLASMIGHGDAINDVKVHPRDPALVLTSSKDESLRLWNLRTFATVAVFAGLKGHRGDVLYADFNLDGSRFASCGIDNSIRVWDLTSKNIKESVEESHRAADLGSKDGFMYRDENGKAHKFRVPIIQFPVYSSRKVHKHYVDCVKWLGDFLLSKSVHNRILLWKTEVDRRELASPAAENTVLLDYEMEDCTVWFVRFELDIKNRLMAVGNADGVIYVYRIDDTSSKPICTLKPPTTHRSPGQGNIIRQVAFSADGSILAGVDDNGTVVRYDKNPGIKLDELYPLKSR